MRYVIVLLVLVVFQSIGWTQSSSKSIYLHDGDIPSVVTATTKRLTTLNWPDNNCGPKGCYAILQFAYMPQEPEKAILADLGISLQDYIPDLAFLALYGGEGAVNLPDFVEHLVPLEANNKRSDRPLATTGGAEDEQVYELVATPFQTVAPVALASELERLGAEALQVETERVTIRVAAELLGEIQDCPLLRFIEPVLGDPIPEGITSADNIRVTDLRTQSGLLLDGANVQLGIQDDGSLGHIDFQGRYYDRSFIDTGTHGEMVAGMAAGGGWLNPIGRGAAPGASVHMFYISDNVLLEQAVANYQQDGICITNTSYGFDCGSGYSSSARDLDDQVYQLPALLHCFSAGNQGQNSCFNHYGLLGSTPEGTFWGNITGPRKSGKNVVAVGNVFWDDRILLSSSRGPTPSGRIKPDMVAQGQGDWTTDRDNGYRISGGSSAASPSAMGGFAVLYQGYRLLHGGQDPSSALIKGLVLNTADDLGPAGPDYSSGWGRMNTAKAWECLESGNYFTGSISHGQTQNFTLPVPANTERLRVMVYWHDAPASVLASRDLVNDLDLKMFDPNGQGRLPWAPSTVPHLDSLNQDALPRIDRVNNVEQVVWDNPQAGNYTIEIQGYQIPSPSQEYYVVYYIETEPLEWVSPAATDALVPGESVVLSWDAPRTTSSFRVEYSLDGGQSWQLVATAIPAAQRSVRWQVPAISTSELRFRVVRAGQEGRSDGNGIIAPQVNFTVQGLNPQSAILNWEEVSGAVAYDIFQLGATEMVRINRVSGLSHTVPVLTGESYWFTVAPVFAGDLVGRRAIAQNYIHSTCNRQVRLQLQFDAQPEQTSWRILDSRGNTLESGGPYVSAAPHSFLELNFCLPEGCHTLVMQDAAGNGMCCQNGNGSYRLLGAQGTILAEGGTFGSFRPQIFCPEEGNPGDPLMANLEIIRPISCAGQSDGVLRVTARGGTGNYEYLWSNGAQGEQLQNAAAGSYAVTVNDGSQTIVVTTDLRSPQPLLLTATSTPSLCGDGTLLATPQGGTPPYSLQWDTGQQTTTLTALAAGEYFGVLTDANNCLTTGRFAVEQLAPLALRLTTVQPTCATPNGGQLSAQLSGGRGSVSWLWSTGQQGASTLHNLSAGDYTLTVVDGVCQQTASAQLLAPQGFNLLLDSFPISCAEGTDGRIEVQPTAGSAPFSYVWSDGGTGSVRDGLGAGIYQVSATDAEGCEASMSQTLAAPLPISLTPLISPAVGDAGGVVEVEISGGKPPYTLLWGGSTSMANPRYDLPPGTYFLTVVDREFCSAFLTVNVPWVDPDTPLEYCAVQGINTSYEWIAGLAIDGQDYDNGNDGGYGDYRYLVLPLVQGEIHDVTLKPGYSFTTYREAWRAWIDWNKDGDFDDPNEMVIDHGPVAGDTQTNLAVPTDVGLGEYQLRIAMQYAIPGSPCSNVTYGEVEDYTVRIVAPQQALRIQPTSGTAAADLSLEQTAVSIQLWPNPVVDKVQVAVDKLTEAKLSYQLKDSQGRILASRQLESASERLTFELAMQPYPRGIYFLYLQSGDSQEVRRLVKK